jgi:hypothetical protein
MPPQRHHKCTLILTSFHSGSAQANRIPPPAGDDILAAVEFVAYRRACDLPTGSGVPERLSVAGIQSDEISVTVAGEGQSGVGGQHARAGFFAEVVAPAKLARLVIDSLNHTSAPHAVVGAGPAIESVGGLGEIEAKARVRVHDEQAVLRVETRRAIVGHAGLVGSDEAPVGCRLFRGIGYRAALLVDAGKVPACREADGSGDVPGKNGGKASFSVHEDDCNEGGDSADFSDPSSGTEFHSTKVTSVAYDGVAHSVTMTGLGTNNGLPVAFTIVSVDSSLVPPGAFSISLSNGYINSGNLLDGSIPLH